MRSSLVCLTASALFFAVTESAQGGLLYAVDASVDSLYFVDSDTGAVTVIGRLNPDPTRFITPVSMAIRPSDGAIFIINNSPAADAGLAIVDAATGLATRIGGSGFGNIAFDSGGTLYAQASGLVRVDPASGATTPVGGPPLPNLFGIDFNSMDGLLYGITGNIQGISDLVRINPTTGAIVSTTPLSQSIGVPGSIVFLPDGALIGSNLSSQLFDIDPATGSVSNFRSVQAGFSPQGLAVPVPEPSTFALIAVGSLGGLVIAWRKRRKQAA